VPVCLKRPVLIDRWTNAWVFAVLVIIFWSSDGGLLIEMFQEKGWMVVKWKNY